MAERDKLDEREKKARQLVTSLLLGEPHGGRYRLVDVVWRGRRRKCETHINESRSWLAAYP
jgi:hypothetical protein